MNESDVKTVNTIIQQLITTNAMQAKLIAPDKPIICLEAISPEKLLRVNVAPQTGHVTTGDYFALEAPQNK